MPKVTAAGDSGAERNQLTSGEEDALQTTFERSFEDTRADGSTPLVDKLMEYYEEVKFAAEVAKHELSGQYDGQRPESGNFGASLAHPGYFGYDDWDAIPDVTGGQANNWLDSDTPSNLSSGNGGISDPLGVGEAATHLIMGVGSYADDPVITRVKFELNDQPEPAIVTEQEFRNTDMRIKWLDSPIVLRPDDNIGAEVFAGGSAGTTYSEAPHLVTVSFLEARYARETDPANMAGTADSNIVVQR